MRILLPLLVAATLTLSPHTQKGSLADDMRIKLLYDLAYTASLERFDTFLRTELGIIFKTPLVMLRMTQGR